MKRYEDIEAWKKARSLTSEVYKTTRQSRFSRDFGLRDQIRRAAISVIPSLRAIRSNCAIRPWCDGTALGVSCGGSVAVANIAEGFGRKTNKDFANFLQVARASAMEVTSHLYVALDQEYISQESFDSLYDGYAIPPKNLLRLRIQLWWNGTAQGVWLRR